MVCHRALSVLFLSACVGASTSPDGGKGESGEPADTAAVGETEGSPETGDTRDTGTPPTDADGDGVSAEEDCDDADPSVGEATTWYPDADGDGYGDDGEALSRCPGESLPDGTWITTGGDCDDSSPEAAPGLEEICTDDLDNDCDGGTTDGCREGTSGTDDAAATILADSEEDDAGCDVVGADIDGDGLADLVVGAPGAGGVGAFYVLTGALSGTVHLADADATANGETLEGWFGWEMAAGDLDGDGYAEVIAGAPLAGQILAFSGPVLGDWTAGDAAAVWTGDALEHLSLAWSEDLSGDGEADLLVGAPFASDPSGAQPGAAWVLTGTASEGALDDEALVLWGQDGDRAGYSVAGVGDVDGDGAADALVGATTAASAGGYGAAYLLRGPLTGAMALEDADQRWLNGYPGNLGEVVAGVGDQDGDGLPDVALGVPGFSWSSTPFEHQGAVFVLSGVAPSASTLEDNSLSTIYGVPYWSYSAGQSLDGGDFDGDGQGDLLIGWSAMYVQVRYGPLEGVISDAPSDRALEAFTFWMESDGRALGASFVGDMDGEGTDDLFVASGDRVGAHTDEIAGWLSYGPP